VGDVRAFAVGDMANRGDRDERVSSMILAHHPDAFLALGDIAYPEATLDNMERYYAPTYGRLDDVVWPTPGNHDYPGNDASPTGYRAYFAGHAPHVPLDLPYYVVTLGGWRLYSLNSEIHQGGTDSDMYRWLQADLEAHPAPCVAAMWHSPIYTVGSKPYDEDGMRPIYDLLVAHGADLVLTGHDHNYQRWEVDGLAYFVVGTGGKSRYALHAADPHPAFGTDQVNGALQLDLLSNGARYAFRTMDDEVLDEGRFGCD
jgi:hypothetical protein